MATRVLTTGRTLATGWDHLVRLLATWSPRDLLLRLWTFLWPTSSRLRERGLRLVWLPFWIGADVPSPRVRRRVALDATPGPASRRLVSYLMAVRRRQLVNRFATLIIRAIALALMLGVGWAAWAATGGPDVDGDTLVAAAAGLIAAGLVFAWGQRPDLRDTARMLDRSFTLSDRISTAFDHLATDPGRRNGLPHLTYLQIAEATNTVAMLGKHRALRMRLPVREIVLVTGLALLFVGLYLLRGTGTGVPTSGNPAVPAFVSAKDRLQQQPRVPTPAAATDQEAPSVQEVQDRADQSATAEEDLLTLADALDDNPLTAPIADSIRAGDYDRAAEQLKSVAPQLSQLSPETRDDLADNLDQAADAMTGNHPGLQDATRNAADGLRSDPQQAESSLSDLGDQISETGETVESQEELASDMRDAREAENEESSSQDTRPEPGDAQADGDQGEQQIAGEGGDAASGQGDQSDQGQQTNGSGSSESNDQPAQSSSESDNGSTDSGNSGADDASSSQGSASGGSGQAEESTGEGASESGSNPAGGNSQVERNSPGESADDAQSGSGSGAGSGSSTGNQTSNGSQQRPGTGSEDSPDPNVISGSGGGSSSSDDQAGQTHASITLSRSPDESGVQTGGASSSSSGSGSGAAAGPGSVSQGDVGPAGPDSNRVPEQYRPIVEDYFSDEP